MNERIQGLEWILSCQRSLRLMRGCKKNLCCHLFYELVEDVVTDLPERER